MHRRQLLQMMGATAVLPFVPRTAEAALAFGRAAHVRAAGRHALRVLDPEQDALVTLLAEQIIPRTDTPGATDVGVIRFIDLLLAEWYPAAERDAYLAGLADFDQRARQQLGGPFVTASEPARAGFLETLDGAMGGDGSAERFFARTKSLTIYGYFTSEPVMTGVLHTVVIPERFDGCVPTAGLPKED